MGMGIGMGMGMGTVTLSVSQDPNVMLAITACPDVLEPIRVPVLLLNHLPQVFRAIVNLASLVNSSLLAASSPSPKG